jgi:hypothetical protein
MDNSSHSHSVDIPNESPRANQSVGVHDTETEEPESLKPDSITDSNGLLRSRSRTSKRRSDSRNGNPEFDAATAVTVPPHTSARNDIHEISYIDSSDATFYAKEEGESGGISREDAERHTATGPRIYNKAADHMSELSLDLKQLARIRLENPAVVHRGRHLGKKMITGDEWEDGDEVCFICQEAAADAVLLGCWHGGLCAGADIPHVKLFLLTLPLPCSIFHIHFRKIHVFLRHDYRRPVIFPRMHRSQYAYGAIDALATLT